MATDAQMEELGRKITAAQDTTVRRVLWALSGAGDLESRPWVDSAYGSTPDKLKVANLFALLNLLKPLQDDEEKLLAALRSVVTGQLPVQELVTQLRAVIPSDTVKALKEAL
jgi:hypothetical protein